MSINIKKIVAVALITTSLFTFTACTGSTPRVTAQKTNLEYTTTEYEVKPITLDKWTFEIPYDWGKLETSVEDSNTYAPLDADLSGNISNVNVVIKESDSDISIKDLTDNIDEALISKIVEVLPTAKDFKYDNFSSKNGDTLVIEYSSTKNDITIKTTQFLILADGYSIGITSADIGDNFQPSPVNVAKHIVDTLTFK